MNIENQDDEHFNKQIGITTFMNTIEGTQESQQKKAVGSSLIQQQKEDQQDKLEHTDQMKNTKLNAILNTCSQGSTEMLRSENNAKFTGVMNT